MKQYSVTPRSIVIVFLVFSALLLSSIYFYIHQTEHNINISCKTIGRVNIPRGDKDYSAKLDSDGDGIACERN